MVRERERVRVGEREKGFPMEKQIWWSESESEREKRFSYAEREREREREVVREKVFLCRAKLTTDSNCPPFTGAGAG